MPKPRPHPSRATPVPPPAGAPAPVKRVGWGGWLSWLYLMGGAGALTFMAYLSWVQNCLQGPPLP